MNVIPVYLVSSYKIKNRSRSWGIRNTNLNEIEYFLK